MALPPSTTPPANGTAPTKADERAAAQQDVFLREVDDALREDQLKTVLQRYGKPIGAAIVAGLLGLAGYLWWENASNDAAAERSETAIIALDKLQAGNVAAADADLAKLASDDSAGTRASAAMTRAAILVEQGKTAEATKAFAAVSGDTDAPAAFRDLAAIREIALNFDSLPPQTVVDRLKPLAVPGNAWFGSAGELVGMAYLKQNKPQLAGPLFAAIGKDTAVPPSLRSRMRQLAGQLGYESATDELTPAAAAPAQ